MAQDMPDWSELQYDLLVLIRRRLNLIEDYLNFGIVCKSWHSVPTKDSFGNNLNRVPWLMLADDEEEEDNKGCRKFYSLYNRMILNKRIPKAIGKRCMESLGWLITVGEHEGEISLLHPFSGVQIQLPHQNTTENHEYETAHPCTCFAKGVLTASPSHTSDYLLMVINGNIRFLSYWRPGDSRWTRIEDGTYADLVYSNNGNFYAVGFNGDVIVVCDDVTGPEPRKTTHPLVQLPYTYRDQISYSYILESLGSLFVVLREGVHARHCTTRMRIPLTVLREWNFEGTELTYGTRAFKVFQIDLANDGKVVTKVTETKELGDRAFFVGNNSSICVKPSEFPGVVKPNHIYFTDDYFESYLAYVEGGGSDMGVCNLADGTIELHYDGVSLSRVCPPIWVTPTLY